MPSDKVVRRRLADGTVRTYTYARTRPQVWTVGRTVAAYRASAAFQRLKPTTRTHYGRALQYLAALDAVPVAEIRRRHIRAIRDALADTPGMANEFVKVARLVLAFALEEDLVDFNPLHRMKALPIGEHQPWTDAQIAAAGALPAYLRRAVVLALYTGQRLADVARATWADYDGAAIRVTQGKTGARLWVPCHADLRAELDTWPRTAVTILTNLRGRPWASAHALGTVFGTVARKTPGLAAVTFHGLRKTAAARLAEAGCSTHEIAAVTGHTSLAMVQHYTKGADQRRRATAAILKLERKGT